MNAITKPADPRAVLVSCVNGMYKQALRETTKDGFMSILFAIASIEILIDIGDRRYDPKDITSFGDLHSYVDANEYGGLCSDDVNVKAEELMPLRTDAGTIATQEFMDAMNDLQNKVNDWIVSDLFKNAKFEYFCPPTDDGVED
jgi:hypothetical protein